MLTGVPVWLPTGRAIHLLANGRAPLLISVTDQHAMPDEDTLVRSGERTSDLAHGPLIGCGVEPTICTRLLAVELSPTSADCEKHSDNQ